MDTPVIIELALNGPTPRSRNPHVPRTPAEIAAVALDGIARGASIVHNHNDEPVFTADGVHAVEPYLAAWAPVLARHPDALLYPTMGAGARGIQINRRWAHVEELAKRGLGGLTLVDPGSVNVGLTGKGAVRADAADGPYQNSYADIDYMFTRTAELHAGPSISIFEPGFVRTTIAWYRAVAAARRHREAVLRRRPRVRVTADADGLGRLPRVARTDRTALVGGRARRRRRRVRARRARLGRTSATIAETRKILGLPPAPVPTAEWRQTQVSGDL
jgi:beta-keto acid cleavage enzyme